MSSDRIETVKRDDFTWKDGDLQVTRSICWSPPGCHGGCGLLLFHRDGKLIRVEGDIKNRYNDGRLCVRGLSVGEMIEHPLRLKKPLLRTGNRGEDKWQEVTFDEAISVISERLTAIRNEHGSESVIFCKGTARDIGAWLPRLCYGFGSPNYFGFGPGSGNACFRPRVTGATAMMGGMPVPDLGQFDYSGSGGNFQQPRCILIWGANPIISNPDGLFGGWVIDALKNGSELIVVDPQKTWLASKAKHWLKLKPGTDGALAMGMIRQIFADNLIDADFCDEWVSGITGVQKVCDPYTLDRTSRITGIPHDEIKQAAQFFARSKPANLIWGVSVDMNPGCLGTISGLVSLITLTGNIEIPGGMILQPDPFGVQRRGDDIAEFPGVKVRRIGAEEYPIIEIGNPYGQPDVLLDQMESGKPYPIKAAWLQGTSVIPSSFADPKRVMKLFGSLDFCVVVDVFKTPAGVAFADVILPAALYPEKDSIFVQYSQVGTINKVVEPPPECRSDAEIILEVGRKVAPEYFQWDSVEEWIDHRLQPMGMDFEELRDVGSVFPTVEYNKQTKGKLRADGHQGFDTPSGKIELDCSVFRKFGLNGLPHFEDCTAEYWQRFGKEDYPFILTTGSRRSYYFGSEQRQVESLRKLQTDPQVQIHPEVAYQKGISQGDEVRIFSPFGSCTMKADISDLFDPEVIHCDYGWWYPERKGRLPELFGVGECNVNELLPSGLQGPGGLGYPFRCFICSIEKV
ncbi:dehydrogenase [candidate division LCP-89 bacterium B3_LCP]|uniref:Dehydrogenase n=1 Tax=candidate division LCP-89 bacterium B3_LCP TaxID=2012998 RepID=A0A532UYF3_UNCL8|nr:MAG: dehydrogenase [candidate division LCP-89 bacterium B3_LCP]